MARKVLKWIAGQREASGQKHVIEQLVYQGTRATHWWSSGCVLEPFVTFVVRFATKVDDVRLFPIRAVHLPKLGSGGGGGSGGRCI